MRSDLDATRSALDGKITTMTAQLRGEINATAAQLHGEINAAVNKMLLAQIATAGLLFAAIKLFGGARVAPGQTPLRGLSK